jgi:fido (protein-threonine AMPylation protein)
MYLAKGVAATAAIEGNTLSEEQVRQQIDGRLEVPASKEYLKQEVENILSGCNMLVDEIEAGKHPVLSAERIKKLNRIVLNNLTLPDEAMPGEIRQHSVGVMDYRGAPAEDCEHLLGRLCDWLNQLPPLQKGQEMICAILKAIVAHVYLAWIHPFADGNGRTARLVEVQILLSSGLPSPAVQLLSNHYNETRSEYYRQLQRSSKSGGDLVPFLRYAIEGFRDGLRSQIENIRFEQWEVAWINHIHSSFRGLDRDPDRRRRKLILELSAADPEWIEIEQIVVICPHASTDYRGKSTKTLLRDIEILKDMKLLRRRGSRVKVNRGIILAFLPIQAVPEGNQEAA